MSRAPIDQQPAQPIDVEQNTEVTADMLDGATTTVTGGAEALADLDAAIAGAEAEGFDAAFGSFKSTTANVMELAASQYDGEAVVRTIAGAIGRRNAQVPGWIRHPGQKGRAMPVIDYVVVCQ